MQMSPTSSIPPSALSAGWHPAILYAISKQPTNPTWESAKQSPEMYHWHLACWEVPTLMGQQEPEWQEGLSTTKFAPKGKFQASKAYLWATKLLDRQLLPGETIDWDLLMPLSCKILVERIPGKDYIKITDVASWPEGQTALPPLQALLAQKRAEVLAMVTMAPAPDHAPQPQAATRQPQAPPPGMQSWGNGTPQTQTPASQQSVAAPAAAPATAPTGKPTW